MVLMRAISRRTWRTRAVFSSWPLARWKRRLNCSFFSRAISSLIWSAVIGLTSWAFIRSAPLIGNALDEARPDRQLRRAEAERLARDVDRDAVDLEHDPAGFDAAHPQFRRALALAHAHFGRLLRNRHVREDADPHPPRTLHV